MFVLKIILTISVGTNISDILILFMPRETHKYLGRVAGLINISDNKVKSGKRL